MAHPIKHAESSARKFGGKAEDYLAIHNWFDESKAFLSDFRHRALRHHAEGIFLCERCLARPSQIATEIQFRCAMWGNSTSRKTWVAFLRHRTGSCRSSHNVGCMANV